MARETSPTERREYDRPPIGSNWATAWDDLVEDLDSNAVYDGDDATLNQVTGIANATKHHIESGESATIPAKYSEVVVGPLEVDGQLEVDGRLEIL